MDFFRKPVSRFAGVALIQAALVLQTMTAYSAPPWWAYQGVTQPAAAPDDFAVANVGQMKTLAAKAAAELDKTLQIGAGDAIHALLASWRDPAGDASRDDFAALTVGQLKTVAKLFHARLVQAQAKAPTYPWAAVGNNDFAPATLGQLKTVFSFVVPDLVWRLGSGTDPYADDRNRDGINDSFATQHNLSGSSGSDRNGNGVSDFVDAWNGSPIPGVQQKAGLYFYSKSRAGYAESHGYASFTDPSVPPGQRQPKRWFRSKTLNIEANVNSSLSSTVNTYQNGFGSYSSSSESRSFTASYSAEATLQNAILTKSQKADGELRTENVSISAQMNGLATASSSSTSTSIFGSSSTSYSENETWSGNGNWQTGDPGPAPSFFEGEFSDGLYTKTTSSNGAEPQTGPGSSFSYGVPQADSRIRVANVTSTNTIDRISVLASDLGSTSPNGGTGWQTTSQWSADYSYNLELGGGFGIEEVRLAALGDIEAQPWTEGYVKAGPGFIGAYAASSVSDTDTGLVNGSQTEYSLEYFAPDNTSAAMPAYDLCWLEVTTRYTKDEEGEQVRKDTIVAREAHLSPGQGAGPFNLHPLSEYSDGSATVSTVMTGYTGSPGNELSFLTRVHPTTVAPNVVLNSPQASNVQVRADGTALIRVSGTVSDPLAQALPRGCGADIATVDILVNGVTVKSEVALTPMVSGTYTSPGWYKFGPIDIEAPLSTTIWVEAECSANLYGKTGRSTAYGYKFTPALAPLKTTEARNISLSFQLSGTLNPGVQDTIQINGQPALETAPESNHFVTDSGVGLSILEDYTPQAHQQTLQAFAPGAPSGGQSILLPGSSTVLCTETGSQTNTFTYTENTPGFDLPRDVQSWSYTSYTTQSQPSQGGIHPFSYSAGVSGSTCRVSPIPGLDLKAISGVPKFNNGSSFSAYAIPAASGSGYDLLYYHYDNSTLVREPFPESLTATITLDGTTVTGATIRLWSLEWQDENGQPTSGPVGIAANLLVDYATRPAHGEVTLPAAMCGYLVAKGLPNGHGIRVESSDKVDSFSLVRQGNMPVGNGITMRLGILKQHELEFDSVVSAKKIVVYSSTPEINRLTNLEWKKLSDLGYYAVHNESVVGSFFAMGVASAPYTAAQSTTIWHHVFQRFEYGDAAIKKMAADFWEGLDIDIDQYTVPMMKTHHTSLHNTAFDIGDGDGNMKMTDRWKKFIEDNSPLPTDKKRLAELRVEAFERVRRYHTKLWDAIFNPRGAKNLMFAWDRMNHYRCSLRVPGGTLGRLAIDDHSGILKLGTGPRAKTAMKQFISDSDGIKKHVGRFTTAGYARKVFSRHFGLLASVVVALGFAGGNVKAAIANAGGITVEAVDDFHSGWQEWISKQPLSDQSVTEYRFRDATYICLGMTVPMYYFDGNWIVEAVFPAKVLEIKPVAGSSIGEADVTIGYTDTTRVWAEVDYYFGKWTQYAQLKATFRYYSFPGTYLDLQIGEEIPPRTKSERYVL